MILFGHLIDRVPVSKPFSLFIVFPLEHLQLGGRIDLV